MNGQLTMLPFTQPKKSSNGSSAFPTFARLSHANEAIKTHRRERHRSIAAILVLERDQ
jgi:hypothetical protein